MDECHIIVQYYHLLYDKLKECINLECILKMEFGYVNLAYRKIHKFSDIYLLYCKHSSIPTKRFYHGVIPLNDANGIANSEDPDQTAPLGAVWSGPALFAQTYLSENLGSLRYHFR